MPTKTEAHLDTAGQNRDLAHALLNATELRPSPLEWVGVIAFYAAVHYVNGYLWEKLHYEPRNHDERQRMVTTVADLKAATVSYTRLRSLAYQARYNPGFRLTRNEADIALRVDLYSVEIAVHAALPSTL
ncbi:MAG: hypothetical protein LC748_05930 [Thermomicrobia bacterium]|nr:hypothetical protein [Thermomicrobia bacterium]